MRKKLPASRWVFLLAVISIMSMRSLWHEPFPDAIKLAESIRMATIKVDVKGVKLAKLGESKTSEAAYKPGEASRDDHLHYQLDNGPVIATPTDELTFADLPSGSHTVTVTLVDRHHNPVGPQ